MGRQPRSRATGTATEARILGAPSQRIPHERAVRQTLDVANSAKGYIDDFFGMTAAESAAPMITSRMAVAGSAALAVYGFGQTLWEIISSAIDLLQFDETIVRDIASAHAFGYWLFDHREFPYPATPPQAMQDRDERSDAFNPYDHFSADEARAAWREAVGTTRASLTSQLNGRQTSHLMAELIDQTPGAQYGPMRPSLVRSTWKINLCHKFGHDPRAAAGAYMMQIIAKRDANSARVLRAQWPRYAYDPRDAR